MPVRLNLFDLNLLRSPDALLREKSVTRAAERLHVTRQAMGGSLKRFRRSWTTAISEPALQRVIQMGATPTNVQSIAGEMQNAAAVKDLAASTHYHPQLSEWLRLYTPAPSLIGWPRRPRYRDPSRGWPRWSRVATGWRPSPLMVLRTNDINGLRHFERQNT